MKIGIAGAGLLGRLAAWQLARAGHQVSVFDPASGPQPRFDGHGAAAFTAAGMLSPLAESETAHADVAELGWHSIRRWEQICTKLSMLGGKPSGLVQLGSLLIAHGPDHGAAQRVLQRLQPVAEGVSRSAPQALSASDLSELEPALHSAHGPLLAWMLPGEAHIDTVRTMHALYDTAVNVQWNWSQAVVDVAAGRLEVGLAGTRRSLGFDWVLDMRGTGARAQCEVRGVRGEVVWLRASGLGLRRPVRLLHPRHRVYIVPRPGDIVLVGASEIESDDRSPMSLRSAVELMAAAHSVLPGLDEARIVKLDANLRPALPDNRPQLHVEAGLLRINGLYRHGWLLAPALLDQAWELAGLLEPGETHDLSPSLLPGPIF